MNNRLNYLKCCSLIATLLLVFVFGMDANAQSAITYTYDTQGRLVSEDYQDAYSVEFEYDEEGNMINKSVSDTLFMPGNKTDVEFVVYPNPAQKGFFINYAFSADDVPDEMTLHDSKGKIIEKMPVEHAKGVLHFKRDLSPGVYILKAGKLCSQKIVIL
ncbi:MAG: T9SS type A sorting domain-containing protein [Candidatus Delongbacteria bacterium]|nr:T9SS type A sorting domain-containing protein [Candidatus Delongbacteria bacterium]